MLLAGVLLQSGGFFWHLLFGLAEDGSAGILITRTGAILIAVALVIVGVGLLRTGRARVEPAADTPH